MSNQEVTINDGVTLGDVEQYRAVNNIAGIRIQCNGNTWTVVIKAGSINYSAQSHKLIAAWECAKSAYETQGLSMLRDEMKRALLTRNSNRLGQLVDTLQTQGANYMDIVTMAQDIDPTLSLAEWETLMQEADECDEDIVAEQTFLANQKG